MDIKWSRIGKAEPQKVEEPVGVAFVAILFGVVVGLIVAELAGETRSLIDPHTTVRLPRVAHLLVGVVLTVLSFLGYFASQNRPQHRIHFFNLPLALFVLDVLMVFDYYVLLQFTEPASGASITTRADARPEAILVAVAFFLYVLWDVCSWRIAIDESYQAVIDKSGETTFGARRWVSIVFFILFAITATAVWYLNLQDDSLVAGIDLVLIALLICYRVAKPLFDSTVKTRA